MIIEELLAFRYKDINFILNKDIPDGIALIKMAKEKEQEERLWQQWVVQIPYMTSENYLSFPEYRDRLTGKNIVNKSSLEILKESEMILERMRTEGKNGS